MVSRVPARTTFEKLWRSGHLMAPLWSVGHSIMCGTVLAALGRYHSPRSTGATSLRMGLEVQVLTAVFGVPRLSCESLISSAVQVDLLAHISLAHCRWSI